MRPAGGACRRNQATDTLFETLTIELKCSHIVVYAPTQFANWIEPALPIEEQGSVETIVRHFLWPLLREGGEPRILNRVRRKRDGPLLEHRILTAPLCATQPAQGFVALLRPHAQEGFTESDLAALTPQAAKLLQLLQQRIDTETGLLRWDAFEAEIARRRRRGAACVVYANLDRMHAINDIAGFEAGDEIIRRVGQSWRERLQDVDAVATHLSGDRYAAILFEHTLNQARSWAEQTREVIAALSFEGRHRGVSASFGIVAMPSATSHQHALAAAETACRVAKDRGRDRVEIYDDGDHTIIRRHDEVRLSETLTAAMESDRLELYAQPIIALAPKARPYHYEILVRVRGETGEMLSLGEFLEAAERYQLLERLDRWVVEHAVEMLAPVAARLRALGAGFAINITGQSLSQPEFADFVRIALKRKDIPPGMIDLEMTEVAAARNLKATQRFITRMAEIGSRIALDDFGTGVSSLVQLKDLDVFQIKIDGKFVRDVLNNARSRALIRALVQIAEELGLETVAEYVEDAAIASCVRDLGVHYAQGHFYGHARPFEETLDALCARPAPATAPAPTPTPVCGTSAAA